MKMIKLFTVFMICISGSLMAIPDAFAHGEKSLEPFVRMRTIQWYDVTWSTDQVVVNDEVVITGKFHVAEDWPHNIPKPHAAYLGLISPGPVFVRKERWINGEAHLNSLALEVGRDYDFKIKLKARIPGRYHLHPSFNVIDTGNIAGPGQWIEITGDATDFSNPVKTVQGKTIDMETYGTSNGVRWHMFWMVIGTAWLVWWLRRPLFIPRYNMVRAGEEDVLVTKIDKTLAKAILIAVPVIVFAAHFITNSKYPEAIPLQASLDPIAPLSEQAAVVKAKVERAVYNVPKRAMTMTVQVKNEGDSPLQLGEFTTGSVRFIDPMMDIDSSDTPHEYLAKTGLKVDPATPIEPGELATVKVIAADAAWETERLFSVIRDADSRFGGLLFFFDDQGTRYLSSISAPLIPEFN